MDVDLSLLHSCTISEIDVTGTYTLPKEYFKNSDVLEIKDIKVDGKIYQSSSIEDIDVMEDHIKVTITGTIIIEDSISLEHIPYPILIEYDDIIEENCKKNENTLDIFQFLWENIVLEVPLRYTTVEDFSKYQGDGWKLVSEDERKTTNNPFTELLKDYKKE